MATMKLPYGKGVITGEISDALLRGVLHSPLEGYIPPAGEAELIAAAMAAPIGSATLQELAKGRRKVTLIISDHTRPVPSRLILPPMLEAIRAGCSGAEITLLVATGCHRPPTREELRAKLGEAILAGERIILHDCDDAETLVPIGPLPSGAPLSIHRCAAEADLLLAEGFIEPHFFAGFSGGRKSVLPGVADRAGVMANHCAEFIAHPAARTGVLKDNPIHADMVWAARAARLAYIVNVILDAGKRVIHAVAGDAIAAHDTGCAFLADLCGISARQADIVITTNGGYPLDQNIYQAVKGMTAAESLVRPGGVIIMLARSEDGHGGPGFYETFLREGDPASIMARILVTPRGETLPDQWQSQIFARVLMRARVIFISDAPDAVTRGLRMTPAHSLDEALALAVDMLGTAAPSVLVVPDGVSVIVKKA